MKGGNSDDEFHDLAAHANSGIDASPGGAGPLAHTFFRTHRAVPERAHHYVKVVTVRAWCVTEAVIIVISRRPHTYVSTSVPAGAYVVENPDGERYAMSAKEFFSRYQLDPEPEPGR
jgi:hypothetical protein